MRRHLVLTLLLLGVACAGCAVQGTTQYMEYRKVVDSWSYPQYVAACTLDLLNDATDIVSVEMAFGPSFLIDICPTEVLEFGAGYADIGKIGWRNRMLGFWRETRKEGGISMYYYRSLDFTPVFGTVSMMDFPKITRGFTIRNNVDRHWMDVGAQANVLFGGFGAWVSPVQFADFVANLVEYPYNVLFRRLFNHLSFYPPEFDLCNDDTPAQVRKEMGLKLVDAGRGFLPAEKLDETFRQPN